MCRTVLQSWLFPKVNQQKPCNVTPQFVEYGIGNSRPMALLKAGITQTQWFISSRRQSNALDQTTSVKLSVCFSIYKRHSTNQVQIINFFSIDFIALECKTITGMGSLFWYVGLKKSKYTVSYLILNRASQFPKAQFWDDPFYSSYEQLNKNLFQFIVWI